MPKPPAAFSPLTMTKSSFQSRTKPGSRSLTDCPAAATHDVADEQNAHALVSQIDDLALR